MKHNPIPTYIINLSNRKDRRANILKEFRNKTEFKTTIIEAIRDKSGALGLWKTIHHILNNLNEVKEEYILICEDDHEFTDKYSSDLLMNCIDQAQKANADILSGGVSWFNNAHKITSNLFWVDLFTGAQFVLIFKKIWNKILETELIGSQAFDLKLSNITPNIYVIYPFISVQKQYNYSDATPKNNTPNYIKNLFRKSASAIEIVQKMDNFYKHLQPPSLSEYDISSMSISTYVINSSGKQQKELLHSQFRNKNEFNLTYIDTDVDDLVVSSSIQWENIINAIKSAITNNDDVIILCDSHHKFTKEYTREYLFRNIIEAGLQGCDYLSGGPIEFRCAVQISSNRFWVSRSIGTQFIIIYNKFFKKILDSHYDASVEPKIFLSDIASNKMVIHPYVSMINTDLTPVNSIENTTIKTFEYYDAVLKRIKGFKTEIASITY